MPTFHVHLSLLDLVKSFIISKYDAHNFIPFFRSMTSKSIRMVFDEL